MRKFLKKFSLKQIKSFDTITTKLLILVLFTTIIPLFAITDLSVSIIANEKNNQIQQLTDPSKPKPSDIEYSTISEIRYITTLSIISLFVAIVFAILFSRKITSPIMNLVKAANEISAGNFNYRLKIRGNDEISKLSATFNQMAENIQKQQQLRDNFVATLTHDLKVPMLAENQTISYLLKEAYGPITDEQREVLELIRSTNNSSLEMVSTLLDIYRYEMGISKLIKSKFNIVELLNESVQEIRSLATEKKMNISIHTTEDNIEIYADKREIKRVIHNLISNAINNGIFRGNIECKIEYGSNKPYTQEYEFTTLKRPITTENSVVISIKDDGVGITREDMNLLFKRFSFSQGRKPAGTGLGLFYSQKVLLEHNGNIWAESTEGKGSKFSFLLPLTADEVENA